MGRVDSRAGAHRELSSDWLARMTTDDALRRAVVDDVADRLESMPSVLRSAFSAIDTGLSALPRPLRRRAESLPGLSEYVRVVESLTAVSYFDATTSNPRIPAQRVPEPVLVEPLA